MLFGSFTYDASVDIWALGCLAQELVSREQRPLFDGACDIAQLGQIFGVLGTVEEENRCESFEKKVKVKLDDIDEEVVKDRGDEESSSIGISISKYSEICSSEEKNLSEFKNNNDDIERKTRVSSSLEKENSTQDIINLSQEINSVNEKNPCPKNPPFPKYFPPPNKDSKNLPTTTTATTPNNASTLRHHSPSKPTLYALYSALPDFGKIQFEPLAPPPNRIRKTKPFKPQGFVDCCLQLDPRTRSSARNLLRDFETLCGDDRLILLETPGFESSSNRTGGFENLDGQQDCRVFPDLDGLPQDFLDLNLRERDCFPAGSLFSLQSEIDSFSKRKISSEDLEKVSEEEEKIEEEKISKHVVEKHLTKTKSLKTLLSSESETSGPETETTSLPLSGSETTITVFLSEKVLSQDTDTVVPSAAGQRKSLNNSNRILEPFPAAIVPVELTLRKRVSDTETEEEGGEGGEGEDSFLFGGSSFDGHDVDDEMLFFDEG